MGNMLIPAESDEYPSRFYYMRVGKEDGPGDWTDVRINLEAGRKALAGNVSCNTLLPPDSQPIREGSAQPPVPLELLFSFPRFREGLLKGMVWDSPSEDDINAFGSHGEYSATVMDTFGKVFYDTQFSPTWKHLGPSDRPPTLFLPCQDLRCLQGDFDPKKAPSEILRDSEVWIRSKAIMNKVCHSFRSCLDSEPPFRKLSSFWFFMPLDSGRAERMLPGDTNTNLWITVHYCPAEPSLAIFTCTDGKNVFVSDADRYLKLLASTLRILDRLWDYQPHAFSADDITWLSDPNLSAPLGCGLANVLHLYSIIYPDNFPLIGGRLGNSELLSSLHQLLLDLCPNARKRMCDFEEESRQRFKIRKVE